MPERLDKFGFTIPNLVTWALLLMSILFQLYGSYFKINVHIQDDILHSSVEEILEGKAIEQRMTLHEQKSVHLNAVGRPEVKELIRDVIKELKREGLIN